MMAKPEGAATRFSATVAIVRTSPETVTEDYRQVLELSGCAEVLRNAARVVVYGNLTWNRFLPSVSSPPWQLDGVATAIRPTDGWRWVAGTGHTSRPRRAARAYNWPQALERHGQIFLPAERQSGIRYPEHQRLLVLDRILPEGPTVPASFSGTAALHLPTFKMHGQVGLAGAVENAWCTWLPSGGGVAAAHPHEVLVDLLLLQRVLHSSICAVMDGAIAGDGAGPRTVEPREMNILLASTDPVALDAVAARLAGIDPLGVRYLALAHALGLGCADVDQVRIVGAELSSITVPLHARRAPAATVRATMEVLRLARTEHWLFEQPWLSSLSTFYYDVFWYHLVGRARVETFRKTAWGALFASYNPSPAKPARQPARAG